MSEGAVRRRDAEARWIAQTVFDRPVVLEAGAGTGKTAAVVARIVAWTVGPGWDEAVAGGSPADALEKTARRVLDGIVAITFTEDAAAEMTSRVAAAFDALAIGKELDRVDGDVLPGLARRALPEDPRTVQSRAEALLTSIESLRTTTIHAFARSLLTRFPVEAGLRPGFEVDADGTRNAEILDRVIEEILGGVLDAAEGKAPENPLVDDIMALAESGRGPDAIRETAVALIEAGIGSRDLKDDPMSSDVLRAVLDRLGADFAVAGPVINALASLTNADTVSAAAGTLQKLAELIEATGDDDGMRALCEIRSWLCDGPPEERRLDKIGEWRIDKPRKGKGENAVFESADRVRVEALLRVCRLISWIVTTSPELFGALRRVVGQILEGTETHRRREGVVGFSDLLTGARRLLEDRPGVLAVLRREISQLLVDEMQDTDSEQARIVELLGLGEGDGPTLFLVGDPKQSIYAWRRADMAVYRRLVREVETRGGEIRSLTVNFRSVPEILDEVGRIVEPSMIEEDDVQPPFEHLICREGARSEVFEADRRPIEHWCSGRVLTGVDEGTTSVHEAAAIEAEAVARDIAALLAEGTPPSEIAVLMRSRTHQDQFLDALKRYGVPHAVGKDPEYYRSREVIEAVALVRTILDPFDLIALTGVLRSPLVGVPDAALAPLWRAGLPGAVMEAEMDGSVLEIVISTAEAEVETLEIPELKTVGRWPDALRVFVDALGELRRSFVEDPPDLFVERLRSRFPLDALAACRFPGAHRLASVDRFLRDLENRLEEAVGVDEILGFLRRVGREQPDDEGGRPRTGGAEVRILTIHGAKGLGFEHVYLVQTHAGGRRGGSRKKGASVVRRASRLELSVDGMTTPGWLEIEAWRKRVEEAERVRLLYVALTRAKRRLVTVGNWIDRAPSGSFLEFLQQRSGGWNDFREDRDDDGTFVDEDGVRWRQLVDEDEPGDDPAGVSGERAPGAVSTGDPGAAWDRVEARKRVAAELQAARWLETASGRAHHASAEEGQRPVEKAGADGPDSRIAMIVGTAIHRLLETLDVGAADPETAFDTASRSARKRLEIELSGDGERGTAVELFDDLVGYLREGPLGRRMFEIGPSIVARELPVIAPPGDSGAVGAVTGTIDLVYRDPGDGRWVVADYKTDRVEGTDLDRRAEAYGPQLGFYAETLKAALGLESLPRRELWFIVPGEIVRLA